MKRIVSLLLLLCMLAALASPTYAVIDVLDTVTVSGLQTPSPGYPISSNFLGTVSIPGQSDLYPYIVRGNWCDRNDPELVLGEDEYFQAGHSYDLYLTVAPPKDYGWKEQYYDGQFHMYEADVTAKVYNDEGEELTPTSVSLDHDGDLVIRLYIVCPRFQVNLVDIQPLANVVPKQGAKPNFDKYKITSQAELKEVTWIDLTEAKILSAKDTFKAGHEYKVNYELTAGPGTEWMAAKGTYTTDERPAGVKVTLKDYDGKDLGVVEQPTVNVQTGVLKASFSMTCEAVEPPLASVSDVDIKGYVTPLEGEMIPFTGFALTTGTVAKVAWMESPTFRMISSGEKFAAGRVYILLLSLFPSDGTKWQVDSSGDPMVNVRIFNEKNDILASKYVTTSWGAEIDGKVPLLVTVTMESEEQMGEAPTIKKAPNSVTASAGSTVLFSVEATGDGLIYQWYAAAGSGSEFQKMTDTAGKSGTSTANLTLSNVTNGMSGSLYTCVVTDKYGRTASSTPAVLTVTASAPKIVFKDVADTDWFCEAVYTAVDMGLINGKGKDPADGKDYFDPKGSITLAQAVKLAACMHQLYTTGKVTLQNGDPWYKTYAEYAEWTAGILVSWGGPGFSSSSVMANPNKVLSRAEFAWIFARCLPDEALGAINEIPDDAIPDVKLTDGSNLYAEEIYKLYRAGILNGSDTKGTFNPGNDIKRSEVAAIVVRMMDAAQRVGAPAEMKK